MYTCERSAFEINERENFEDIFIDTLSFFKNFIEMKNDIFTEIYKREC